MKKIIFIILFSIITFHQISGQYVNLPIGHWAYFLLDRFETKGYLENLNYHSKPFTREEIANIIISISQKIEKGEVSLSNTEKALFEKLKGEFFDELHDKNIKINPKEKEPHLFTWKEKK